MRESLALIHGGNMVVSKNGKLLFLSIMVIFLFLLGYFEVANAENVVKKVTGTWVNIGPDGGDNYFIFITSNHTVIAATGNSAFRSTDEGKTWHRITKPDLIDIGFVSMAEADGVIFAGVGNGRGIMISYDDGESWAKINTNVEEIEKEEFAEVVSIVALSKSRIFFGIKSLNPASKNINCIYELKKEKDAWIAIKHELPWHELPPGTKKVVYRLAYNPEFKWGSYLFVSKYPVGLFVLDLNTMKWTKIFEGQTTAVDVGKEVVYVGTYNDWIYRGELKGGRWKWTRLNPVEMKKISLERPPVISDVKVDPYNENRFWWGSPGKLVRIYPYPENHKCLFGVAVWDPSKGWLHSFVSDGWGAFFAIDKNKPNEDPSLYTVFIDGEPGAKIAYTPSYSFKSVLKTVDGGKTWFPSYEGLYGECMNAIWFLNQEPHPHTFIALCQAGIEITYDYGNTWEEFDVPPTAFKAGFPWAALPLPKEFGYKVTVNEKEYDLDLILITAYPGPVSGVSEEKVRNYGALAVSTSYVAEVRKAGKTKDISKGCKWLTSNPAVHGTLVDKRYMVLALQEDGVEVYDLELKKSFTSNKGLPSGLSRIAVYEKDNKKYWFAVSYEGKPTYKTEGNDHYFWDGPSRIFFAMNLLKDKENTKWVQVYPAQGKTEKGIVSVIVGGNDELVALESSGKIIYGKISENPSFITLALKPLGEAPELYTALRIDWNNGVIYISSVGGEGVYYAFLDEVRAGEKVRCYPFNNGLSTRLIRHLAITPDGKYLFAGGWWSSSWRIEPKIEITAIEKTPLLKTPYLKGKKAPGFTVLEVLVLVSLAYLFRKKIKKIKKKI